MWHVDHCLDGQPIKFLAGFDRIFLDPGETQQVSFGVSAFQLSVVDAEGHESVLAANTSHRDVHKPERRVDR
jgi:hypothetical protein